MSKCKSQSANNQRSNVKNQNNPAHVADRINRIQQGHANVPPLPASPPPATSPKK